MEFSRKLSAAPTLELRKRCAPGGSTPVAAQPRNGKCLTSARRPVHAFTDGVDASVHVPRVSMRRGSLLGTAAWQDYLAFSHSRFEPAPDSMV